MGLEIEIGNVAIWLGDSFMNCDASFTVSFPVVEAALVVREIEYG
jgi:hypothetical protein